MKGYGYSLFKIKFIYLMVIIALTRVGRGIEHQEKVGENIVS